MKIQVPCFYLGGEQILPYFGYRTAFPYRQDISSITYPGAGATLQNIWPGTKKAYFGSMPIVFRRIPHRRFI